MLFPKSTQIILIFLPHQLSMPKILPSLKPLNQNNYHHSILKISSSVNTPQITCLRSIGTSTLVGVNHPLFLSVPSPFIPSIPPYIMLSNVLKVWKPTKTQMEKLDCSDQIVTHSDLKNLPKESLYQTSMARNSSNLFNNLSKLNPDGFHQFHNSVFISDLYIFQWKIHWESRAPVNLNFWFSVAPLVLTMLQASNQYL